MKVWMKKQNVVQENKNEILVGICDEELLGKEIGQLKLSEEFFKGELIEIEDALIALEDATIANLVGENIVNAALEKKIIDESGIKKIENVPHAQIFTII